MKHTLIIALTSILFMTGCECKGHNERFSITLSSCIDGDTARFKSLGRVRFLYIDTPEIYPIEQPLGKEAKEFTCEMLENAQAIYIEYDNEKEDQYGRILGWIWVDDQLLQEELTKAGYVNRFFEFDQPKYKERIQRAYQQAKKNKLVYFDRSMSSKAQNLKG